MVTSCCGKNHAACFIFSFLGTCTYLSQHGHVSIIKKAHIVYLVGLVLHLTGFAWTPNLKSSFRNGFGGSYQSLTFIGLTISTTAFRNRPRCRHSLGTRNELSSRSRLFLPDMSFPLFPTLAFTLCRPPCL